MDELPDDDSWSTEDIDEDARQKDYAAPVRLGPQAIRIWRSLVPLIYERTGTEAKALNILSDRLDKARDLLWDLAGALNEADTYTDTNLFFWSHRRPEHIDGISKVERERIDRRWLLETVANYLSRPWMQHPEIDWIALDSLIYAEVTAFRETIVSGSLVGKMNWPYILAAGNPLKLTLFRSVGSVVGWLARYVVPAVTFWMLLTRGYTQTAVFVGAVWGLYVLGRLAMWPQRRRTRKQLTEAVALLQKMVAAYAYCDPPVINPSVLLSSLNDAAKAGARFDGAVFTILEGVVRRDSSTFLPFVLESSDVS